MKLKYWPKTRIRIEAGSGNRNLFSVSERDFAFCDEVCHGAGVDLDGDAAQRYAAPLQQHLHAHRCCRHRSPGEILRYDQKFKTGSYGTT